MSENNSEETNRWGSMNDNQQPQYQAGFNPTLGSHPPLGEQPHSQGNFSMSLTPQGQPYPQPYSQQQQPYPGYVQQQQYQTNQPNYAHGYPQQQPSMNVAGYQFQGQDLGIISPKLRNGLILIGIADGWMLLTLLAVFIVPQVSTIMGFLSIVMLVMSIIGVVLIHKSKTEIDQGYRKNQELRTPGLITSYLITIPVYALGTVAYALLFGVLLLLSGNV